MLLSERDEVVTETIPQVDNLSIGSPEGFAPKHPLGRQGAKEDHDLCKKAGNGFESPLKGRGVNKKRERRENSLLDLRRTRVERRVSLLSTRK